jgi:hypothetical protein
MDKMENSFNELNRNTRKQPNEEPNNETTREPNNETTREPNNETTREPNNENTREPNKENTREPNKETTREPNNETTREPNNENTREPNKETTREPNNENTREPNKETTREPNNETTREPNNENTREPNKETTREPNKETTREPNKETTREPNKETTRELNNETTRELNNETTMETIRLPSYFKDDETIVILKNPNWSSFCCEYQDKIYIYSCTNDKLLIQQKKISIDHMFVINIMIDRGKKKILIIGSDDQWYYIEENLIKQYDNFKGKLLKYSARYCSVLIENDEFLTDCYNFIKKNDIIRVSGEYYYHRVNKYLFHSMCLNVKIFGKKKNFVFLNSGSDFVLGDDELATDNQLTDFELVDDELATDNQLTNDEIFVEHLHFNILFLSIIFQYQSKKYYISFHKIKSIEINLNEIKNILTKSVDHINDQAKKTQRENEIIYMNNVFSSNYVILEINKESRVKKYFDCFLIDDYIVRSNILVELKVKPNAENTKDIGDYEDIIFEGNFLLIGENRIKKLLDNKIYEKNIFKKYFDSCFYLIDNYIVNDCGQEYSMLSISADIFYFNPILALETVLVKIFKIKMSTREMFFNFELKLAINEDLFNQLRDFIVNYNPNELNFNLSLYEKKINDFFYVKNIILNDKKLSDHLLIAKKLWDDYSKQVFVVDQSNDKFYKLAPNTHKIVYFDKISKIILKYCIYHGFKIPKYLPIEFYLLSSIIDQNSFFYIHELYDPVSFAQTKEEELDKFKENNSEFFSVSKFTHKIKEIKKDQLNLCSKILQLDPIVFNYYFVQLDTNAK